MEYKLNVGSNSVSNEGYINLDGLDLPTVDAICDLSDTPYWFKVKNEQKFTGLDLKYNQEKNLFAFEDNVISEISSVEFLEHISFRKVGNVVHEWFRILKPNGKVHIQVPDCGKMMEYYVKGWVCDCVPHKGSSEDFHSDPFCFKCSGKGKVNPIRWLFAFTGAQKHQYDAHLNIFTQDRMKSLLSSYGFRDIVFEDNLYKIKCSAIK